MTNPVIDQYGTKEWYQNGKYHRTDGPAIEYADGTKYWYQNGQGHRTDGPAIERADGTKEYWINGKRWDYLPSKEELIVQDIIE